MTIITFIKGFSIIFISSIIKMDATNIAVGMVT